MTTDTQTVIIGGGVIGLAIADALCKLGHEVLVLERNAHTGTEISAHNSQVIHAGLYYPPDSNRARFCVDGRSRLYKFADENGVPVSRLGKLIVATSDADLDQLNRIAKNAAQCGVTNLEMLSPQDAAHLEPELSCKAALRSPSTGIIDVHALMVALEGHITTRNGQIILNTEVTGINQTRDGNFKITVGTDKPASLTSRNLIIAAGLSATRIAQLIHWPEPYTPPHTYPIKGHYFQLTGRAPFKTLIYPVPESGGLGIHLTLDLAGEARFGPDTSWPDASGPNTATTNPSGDDHVPVDYSFDDENGKRAARFEEAIRRYWPSLPVGALSPADTGIRPKLHTRHEPVADFAIHDQSVHGVDRLISLFGIESPGITSSLAIGAHVANLLNPR